MKELEFHPYANLFPLIEGQAFADLVHDIADNGLCEPIVLFEGKILDGRNRYRAALQAGVIDAEGKATSLNHHRPTRRQFPTSGIEGDALTWVISRNLHRRHLGEAQRAMVAAKLANMGHGGYRPNPCEQAANLPDAPAKPAPVTQAKAAELLNVSERSVRSAKAVVEHGAPELVAKADAGAIAVSVAAELAKLPVDDQREVLRSADPGALYRVIKDQRDALTAQKKTKRIEKVKALGAKQRALPNRKFGVIYADPEWEHLPWSEQGQNKAAANHYPVSSTAVIKARPVRDIAADDCVLFMWTTVPHLAVAFEVVTAWGFTYRSSAVWKKIYPGKQQGLGYWFRVNHEILIVATRGNVPAPAPGTQWGSVIEAPVGEHSEKPDAVYELIEHYFGELPKIELNARKARPGWDAWGLEAPEQEGGKFEATVASLKAEPAHYVVEHRDVRAIVETGGFGPAIYALDLNRPFPSSTGYHSMLGTDRKAGESAEEYGRRLIDESIAYSEKSRGKTKALMLPERAYTLQLDDKGHPTSRARGVWVDRDAPPLGLDFGLIEGLDVILARWKEEDHARLFSGRKGKRTCPESWHSNDKIIAVSGQMLKPLADFPTEGAYVVTAFKWVDGERVNGWRFVDEAAFHDQAPPPAPADTIEDADIPAFLRRDPDTAEMLPESVS